MFEILLMTETNLFSMASSHGSQQLSFNKKEKKFKVNGGNQLIYI